MAMNSPIPNLRFVRTDRRHTPFPLTPALSPGEKEDRAQRGNNAGGLPIYGTRTPVFPANEPDLTTDYTDNTDKSASLSAKSAKSVVQESVQGGHARSVAWENSPHEPTAPPLPGGGIRGCRERSGTRWNASLPGSTAQSGVALVITLIMLSLVTLMAVVFLAVSRREKISVTVTNDQTDSRLMAEAGTARAVSEIIARILATTNPFNYDLIVSTNFINPNGFRPGAAALDNVSYTYANGRPLANLDDQLRNLANLQFDPRPPVFVPTNRLGSNEFRFYLDLNRNGRFETNGFLPMLGNRPGELVSTNGFTTDPASAVWSHFVGDPEWIGVLERPERPHSDSNFFIGRYCYLVLPAGKTLDLNFIHNSVKSLNNPTLLADGYSRNTGLGSWELNLAGFLRDLNTNSWRDYVYRPAALVANTGTAFDDARTLLRHRYRDERPNLPTTYQLPNVPTTLGAFATLAFRTDGLDNYGDGPLLLSTSLKNLDVGPLADQPAKPWPGSPNPQLYYDVQELFNLDPANPDPASRTFSAFFTNRFVSPMTNAFSSYDRYTFYRYLAQMGTDSTPAVSNRLYGADFRMHYTNKLHINYRNDLPDGLSSFIPWDPVVPGNPSMAATNAAAFFSQAADRLLRANLRRGDTTNALVLTPSGQLLEAVSPMSVSTSEALPGPHTHFLMGNTPVRTNFGLNNIQLLYSGAANGVPFYMTNNEYNATTHRLLQVAANLYDSTTTRTLGTTNDYPSVFRPYFVKTSTNVIIHGYVEERGMNLLLNNWMTAQEVALAPNIPTNTPLFGINIFGVPAVIGAKKGYPNFNELSMETAVQVSRKLEIRKLSANTFQTNQMYVVGISNIFGVEAWNSYTQNFQRAFPFELRVTNRYWTRLFHVVDNTVRTLRTTSGLVSSTITNNIWTNRLSPSSFLLPIHTNVHFLTNSAYLSRRFPFLLDPRSTNSFENTFDPPQLFLLISNRLQYAMIDKSVVPPRIVDFVNLDNLVTSVDISGLLVADTARTGGRFFSGSQMSDGDLWNTNRVAASARSPTIGVVNQINVALGDPNVAPDVWRSHVENPVTGGDKQKAIEKFREFFSPLSTNLVMQVPFTPTRKIYQRTTWQANDPLVHYTPEDLTDPVLTSSRNALFIRPPNNPLPVSNLGLMNERYRPWGGNPNRTADASSYRMSIKDPLVRSSDDWDFPTNRFPNIGWLGRVHRGTPWQTIYLKAGAEEPNLWVQWAGSYGTHPTNDWKLLDLFTVAPNPGAARGLLSVNQTNLAAWSAVLSGVAVLSNSLANPGPITGMKFDDLFIQPNSPHLSRIVDGINRAKAQQPTGTFQSLGDVLAAPELTVASPFLNLSSPAQLERGLTDVAVERIPQQILSLLKTDDARIVIYAFGQSLKPAERSLVTAGSFYNICTNYQITGEYATKTVIRIEDAPRKPRAVVESFTILPPE